MARARRRSARPSGPDPLRVNRSHFARRSVAAACPHRAHRLERLEPYEGKLSSTVLRGGRAGNSPPPLDLWLVRFSNARTPLLISRNPGILQRLWRHQALSGDGAGPLGGMNLRFAPQVNRRPEPCWLLARSTAPRPSLSTFGSGEIWLRFEKRSEQRSCPLLCAEVTTRTPPASTE
jgi:hypothetical protein